MYVFDVHETTAESAGDGIANGHILAKTRGVGLQATTCCNAFTTRFSTGHFLLMEAAQTAVWHEAPPIAVI